MSLVSVVRVPGLDRAIGRPVVAIVGRHRRSSCCHHHHRRRVLLQTNIVLVVLLSVDGPETTRPARRTKERARLSNMQRYLLEPAF